jgi:hypothetical protein
LPQFDVFNDDADGLCALHQLRLAVTPYRTDVYLLPEGDWARRVSSTFTSDLAARGAFEFVERFRAAFRAR